MRHVALAVGAFTLMVATQLFTTTDVSAAQYGKASYYWQPQPLASGGRFNPNAMSAAHKTLPFGTKVRVTRKSTGRSVVVTINDRGPYIKGRIIDLSRAAAQRLGMTGAGVTAVRVDVIGRGSVKHLALGGNGGKYGGNRKYKSKKKSKTRKYASLQKKKSRKYAGVKKKSGKKYTRKSAARKLAARKAKRSARKQRYAGIPKSLRNKKIISVKRRYSIGGKVRTTSGRLPKGATLIMEEITYYN